MIESWEIKKLKDIGKVQTGTTPSTADLNNYGTYIPFVKPAHFKPNGEIHSGESMLSEKGLKSGRYFESNSVLMVCIGATIGKVGYTTIPVSSNQQINAITPNKSSYYKFVYYYMTSLTFQKKIIEEGTSAQATLPIINKSKWENLEIPIPPLSEQKEIVAIIDTAFEAIEQAKANIEKNIANAKELFQSKLNDIFSQKGEGWEEKRLGDIISISHGYAFKSEDFETDYKGSNPVVLTPGNFSEDSKLYFTAKNTKRCMSDFPSNFKFNEGDLVVVMTDLSSKMKILGKPAIIDSENILHNQRIGRIIFKSREVEKSLLYYYFQSEKYLAEIKLSATGTMVRHTAPSRILKSTIPFPKLITEQEKIVYELSELREKVDQFDKLYKNKMTILEELKKSILQKAFAGELTQKEVVV
jgi:type I restriction enzyme S subunit